MECRILNSAQFIAEKLKWEPWSVTGIQNPRVLMILFSLISRLEDPDIKKLYKCVFGIPFKSLVLLLRSDKWKLVLSHSLLIVFVTQHNFQFVSTSCTWKAITMWCYVHATASVHHTKIRRKMNIYFKLEWSGVRLWWALSNYFIEHNWRKEKKHFVMI